MFQRLSRATAASTITALLALTSCGVQDVQNRASLRDAAAVNGAAIALETDGQTSPVIVHLPADHNDIALCFGDSQTCINPNETLTDLQKTSPGFWRSVTAVNLHQDLVINVVDRGTTPRSILLSVKISAKNTLQNSSQLLPAPANLAQMRPIPGVSVAYDYQGVMTRDSGTAAAMRMVVQNGALQAATSVKVTGMLVNLRDSSQKIPVDQTVAIGEGKSIDFTISGLQPETPYRMEKVSVVDATSGAGGALKDFYYLATAADSNLSKAKRRLVLRALAESYDWDHGNYDNSKGYYDYSWCDHFYSWAASKDFKVRSGNSSPDFFRQYHSLGDARKIPSLAQTESMTADMIRYEGTSEGTHTFMIIAYDVASKTLWTVEGNFNDRVMRRQRNINSPWMHGHLSESQLR